ncbi:hypothetical protein [Pseudomonas putida]|uniref:hypothetical protein n=1 Tax=Pseudomonas putida TaxID=303 RepID=UPI000FFB9B09|nr:hypothetical protein [Pseudomonas putida]MDD1987614.1 hypothetical protein [Pseudomonas putida]UZM91610.1 hypothetical protein OPZ46_17100 [Pseudomonas putida DOT-T1E]HDS1792686.1 hypothetical protein [Pseudomonas putida]
MTNSTEDNIEARLDWLNRIISHEITPNDAEVEALSDLRTFLAFAIKGCFTQKAYNTIKAFTVKHRSIATPHHYPNTWEYLKELRTLAHHETAAKARLVEGERNLKDLENRALLEAHLCGMAYIDAYEFIRSLLKEPSLSGLLEAKIENFISITNVKYAHITSHAAREGGVLQVIQGGKP